MVTLVLKCVRERWSCGFEEGVRRGMQRKCVRWGFGGIFAQMVMIEVERLVKVRNVRC